MVCGRKKLFVVFSAFHFRFLCYSSGTMNQQRPSSSDIDAIVLDLDGTLLSSSHVVLSETRNELMRLQAMGKKLIFCTGRTSHSTRQITKDFETDVPLVLANGAIVEDPSSDFLYRSILLGGDIVRKLSELIQDTDLHLQYFSSDCVYITEDDLPKYIEINPFSYPHALPLERGVEAADTIVKAMIYGHEESVQGPLIIKALMEAFPERICSVSTFANHVEIMDRSVNKIVGLRFVSDLIGIPCSRMIAFGDAESDVEMLKAVGWGVSMGNGQEKVKECADAITDDNDHDGIGQYLREFFQ